MFDDQNRPIDILYLEVNLAVKRITGLDLAGRSLREIDPNYESHWWETYGRVAQTGIGEQQELYAEPLKSWFSFYAFKVGDVNSHRVAAVFQDVTKRKNLEQERDRFLAVGLDLQVITGNDGYFRWISPTFERLLGWTPAEMTARPWTDFVHPDDVPDSIAEADSIFSGTATFGFENRYRHKDGSYRWFLWNAQPYLAEGVMYGVAIDITDRKLAEATIATDLENARLLRDLSARLITEDNIQVLYNEIMATAITLTQADAGTVQILDKATQDLVLLASQGFDRTITDHFYRVNASSNTSCGIALRQGTRTFIEFDVPESDDPDGSLRMHINAGYFSAQSTPLISRSLCPTGMVSTHWRKPHQPSDRELRFLDLLARQTAALIEQRQTEAERQQSLQREQAAREEEERANRIKDEFLAVLSHELRTPMNPIVGWTSLLKQGKLNPTKTTEAIAIIDRNAKLQVQLIDDLLDISRILQGKLTLNRFPVNLKSVIYAAVETVQLAADAKVIALQTQLASADCVNCVIGDAGRLQQAVWNLLSNAIKFTNQGGQVTITLATVDTIAQIQVQDTGKGIHPDFLPYVFEHFRQEDGATTRKFGGLGLGLAIARQIIETHGGQISVDSSGEGQGATFTVQLPIASQAPLLVTSQPFSDSSLNLSSLHILVVDDEPDSRDFVAFVLEQSGAIVTSVASGIEALQAIEQSIPDLVVSDIGMPEMDGYMLLQQVRPLQIGKQIPAIALTAYAGEFDQQQALQAGFQQHLRKPIEPDKLTKAIFDLVN